MPGIMSVRRILIRVTVIGQDQWRYFADDEDEAFRYKQGLIEEHGRANVSFSIISENLSWSDDPLSRMNRYYRIGDNAANGKKKASSVAGRSP
jgi:hypothetical protein